jgi:ATP-dependent Lon protease
VDASGLPGLALGLAWTPAGGQILTIEAAAVPGRGALKLTGSLGDVMKESADAALTWLREHAPALGDLGALDIHVHVPAGAVPKDGPSAGVALLAAIASAVCKRPLRHDLAMTGEITLRGQVLAVGAIREKVMAAPRAGIRAIVLPRLNADDLSEVPREILDALEVHLVDRVEEALALALPAPERRRRRAATKRPRRRPR